ncbi:MAG: hypothetical protein AAF732_03895 [Pseudomonadota bacterium]
MSQMFRDVCRVMRSSLAVGLRVGILCTLSATVAMACDESETDDLASSCDMSGVSRISSLLDEDPTDGRLASLQDGTPWIAATWLRVPVTLAADSDAWSFRGSSRNLAGFANSRIAQRIEDARALAGDRLVVPKSAAVDLSAPFDVWGAFDLKEIDDGGPGRTHGQFGIDYSASRNTVFGMMLRLGEETDNDTWQDSHGVSAYVLMRLGPPLTFDATAQWSNQTGTWSDQAVQGRHRIVQARLRGKFDLPGGIVFAPSAAFARGLESVRSSEDSAAFRGNKLTLEPTFSRSVNLDTGAILKRHFSLKADSESHRAIGAGITLTQPDMYALDVTTGIERSTDSDSPNVTGQLKLSLPLR